MIEKRDQLGIAERDTRIVRARLLAAVAREVVQRDALLALVKSAQRCELIRVAVHDDENTKVRIALAQCAVDRKAQRIGLAVGRDHHRDARPAHQFVAPKSNGMCGLAVGSRQWSGCS